MSHETGSIHPVSYVFQCYCYPFSFVPPQARFAQQQLLNEIARKEAEEKARREKEEEEERNRLRLERERLEREAELKRLQEEVCGGGVREEVKFGDVLACTLVVGVFMFPWMAC